MILNSIDYLGMYRPEPVIMGHRGTFFLDHSPAWPLKQYTVKRKLEPNDEI